MLICASASLITSSVAVFDSEAKTYLTDIPTRYTAWTRAPARNGGYACGRVAAYVDADAVEVDAEAAAAAGAAARKFF